MTVFVPPSRLLRKMIVPTSALRMNGHAYGFAAASTVNWATRIAGVP